MIALIASLVLFVLGIILAIIYRENGKNESVPCYSGVAMLIVFGIVAIVLMGVGLDTTFNFVTEKATLYAFSNNIDAYLISIGLVKDCLVEEPYQTAAKWGLGINIENRGQSTNNTVVTKDYRDYIIQYNELYFNLKCRKEAWLTNQFIWTCFPNDLSPYTLPLSGLK